MNKKIIIGARGSKLSLSYVEKVKKLFFLASGKEKGIEIQIIKTSGDIFHDKKISDIGGKNIFCKEIENQLLDKKVDIAVHSLKDMDSFEENDLTIGAYLKRNDPRDGIVLRNGKSFDSDNLIIGSSSKRREFQFKSYFKNMEFDSMVQNVLSEISSISDFYNKKNAKDKTGFKQRRKLQTTESKNAKKNWFIKTQKDTKPGFKKLKKIQSPPVFHMFSLSVPVSSFRIGSLASSNARTLVV